MLRLCKSRGSARNGTLNRQGCAGIDRPESLVGTVRGFVLHIKRDAVVRLLLKMVYSGGLLFKDPFVFLFVLDARRQTHGCCTAENWDLRIAVALGAVNFKIV